MISPLITTLGWRYSLHSVAKETETWHAKSLVQEHPGLLVLKWDLFTVPLSFLTVASGSLTSCMDIHEGELSETTLVCDTGSPDSGKCCFSFFSLIIVMDVWSIVLSCFSEVILYLVEYDFFLCWAFEIEFDSQHLMTFNSLAWNNYHFLFHLFLDFSGRLEGSVCKRYFKEKISVVEALWGSWGTHSTVVSSPIDGEV